jgi:lipopolysaccharide/colanic/teichoic acid biosynthesis glycosyltransferase
MTPTSVVTTHRRTGSPQRRPDGLATAACDGSAVQIVSPVETRSGGFDGSLAVKALLDYALGTFFLVLSAPLFLVIAALIKLTSPGPVFFMQERVGRGGKVFPFYKFRTMKHNSDDSVHREFSRDFICGDKSDRGNGHGRGSGNGNGHGPGARVYKLTRDPRVTAVGSFLRRTSLDELPQLFNVLRGEMSLVGPRPPVVYELEHYQDWHKRRLAAKPGITGLWQVSGRSSVPFDEMVLLDLYYIEHRSTLMDVRIMVKTLPVMLTGSGGY